jgi:hypothetical protein
MTHRQKMLVRAYEVWQETHDKMSVLLVTSLEECTESQCRYVERRVKVWEASCTVRTPEDQCPQSEASLEVNHSDVSTATLT